MKGTPHGYQRKGFVLVALLVLLVVVLGWRASSLIGPQASTTVSDVSSGSSTTGRQFLVYATQVVSDRGADDAANDDAVTYEFVRHTLDGAAVTERLLRIEHGAMERYVGAPLMLPAGDDVLRVDRRDGSEGEVSWMDVSGVRIDVPTDDPYVLGGIPSPDGSRIAYADLMHRAVSVLTLKDGLTKSYATTALLDLGYLAPKAWSPDSSVLYLEPIFEGEGFVSGLWVLRKGTDALEEIGVIRELGLVHADVNPDANTLAGVTFRCDSVETCGAGPSALYVVDLATGTAKKLLDSPYAAYRTPHLSPDGTRIAYAVESGSSEIRIVDVADPGTDRRLISGHLLDWTPDGTRLVVDRDSALQLVDVETGMVTTVARRQGSYLDPDYKGLDYIGIIRKR